MGGLLFFSHRVICPRNFVSKRLGWMTKQEEGNRPVTTVFPS